MKFCPKCGIKHNKFGIFCSRSCANSRVCSQELRDKLSLANKGKPGHNKTKGREFVPRFELKCKECQKIYKSTNKEQKYCCLACAKMNYGGYRAGSGRAKSGYYKGIYCGSTYELVWVIYQLDHNKQFKRFDSFLEYDGRKYFPDFIQDDKIIEIKGYELQSSVDIKNNIAKQNGYSIIVLRKNDLKDMFEWVNNHYTSNYKTLYDEYKPNYNYICCNCGLSFSKDKRLKTAKVYCSRSCSGKGNSIISKKSKYTKLREAADVATSPSNWGEGIETPTEYHI